MQDEAGRVHKKDDMQIRQGSVRAASPKAPSRSTTWVGDLVQRGHYLDVEPVKGKIGCADRPADLPAERHPHLGFGSGQPHVEARSHHVDCTTLRITGISRAGSSHVFRPGRG